MGGYGLRGEVGLEKVGASDREWTVGFLVGGRGVCLNIRPGKFRRTDIVYIYEGKYRIPQDILQEEHYTIIPS